MPTSLDWPRWEIPKDDTKRFFLLKGLNAEFERNCLSTIISYESRDGLSGANYDKAVKILSDWADGHKVTAKPRRETAMAAGPGKAQARQTPTEPCRRFSKGICKLGGKCRYLHVDAPGRPVQPPPTKRRNLGSAPKSSKAKVFAGQCFACGRHGHRKKDCLNFKKTQDSCHVIQENIREWPATRTEDQAWVAHSNFTTAQSFPGTFSGSQGSTTDFGFPTRSELGKPPPMVWLVDGGTTCHVLCTYDYYNSYIYNRQTVDIDIVGVGGHVKCREIGDMCIRVITNGIPKVINLLEVRLCRSPGMNLLSGPRMEAAGWGLSYKNRVFTATDKHDRLLMTVKANEKGLYFITGAPCYPNGAS